VASVVFKRPFASEELDKHWRGGDPTPPGPMLGVNQALSHIVFFRDRARFESESPELELTQSFTLGNHLRYLCPGG
jgi:hypothetical protein